MRLDAFDYSLPASLIAQEPLADRPASRLMVVDRGTGGVAHARFGELPRFLDAGDALVLNRSRVIPARLLVRRPSGGRGELLVLRIVGEKRFLATGQPLRAMPEGTSLHGDGADYLCRVVQRRSERELLIEVESGHTVREVLEGFGHVPLPPYIQRPDEALDRKRYQTVYAREEGSAAAPTAGLHFDDELLSRLERAGVGVHFLVLHVGLGTFLPLTHDVVEENSLHRETFSVDGALIDSLQRVRREGGRVVAVGTTSARALESLALQGRFEHYDRQATCHGDTDLFVRPGFDFAIVDGLITNFHLPKSSLLVLVGAFLGVEKTLACYRQAVEKEYRFFSYGDAMFIRSTRAPRRPDREGPVAG
ncbi:MAG: tRNA preQ1(34) S-adenosylmethionine ribosyltransferase-isomerase QueA [Candidatus Krumholzibacteriia bacterium]